MRTLVVLVHTATWTALAACSGDTSPNGFPLPPQGLDGEIAAFLSEYFVEPGPAYREAGQRLAIELAGGDAEGVELSPGPGARTGSIHVDRDMDGSRETRIDLFVSEDPSTPGALNVMGSLGDYGEDLLTVSARGRLDGGQIVVDMGTLTFESEEAFVYGDQGEGRPIAEAPEGEALGSMNFSAFDRAYEEHREGVFTVESDGDGGTRIRVTIEDDPKTPEDETTTFIVD
ncbi:MAG: hypothetical protein KTR31_11725 [Myxococcales bacterium]|nr:hypothetical protein [Myxococcales bacterium]